MAEIAINSDNVVEVLGLADQDGTAITTATVTVNLYNDDTDALIAGPISLTHDADGDYRGNIPDTTVLTTCTTVRAEFTADDGAGWHLEWQRTYDAVYSTMTPDVFIDDSDNTLTLNGLYDPVGEAYLNAATVTCTLKHPDGTEVAGQSWPTTMAYVSGSDGAYQCNLADTLDVDDGDAVKVVVNADGGGTNQVREFHSILTVKTGT